MKSKITVFVLFSLSVFNCTIEIEDDEKLIEHLAGKWELISITFDGDQQITECDKTTTSEFITNSAYKGSYTGTVYFWTEALDSCNPEIFNGTWKSDDGDFDLTLTISGANTSYTNNFRIIYTYSSEGENDDVDNSDELIYIDLIFENEDEDFERIYTYRRST
ncbi:hypothetical protein SAMN05421824_1677 [Hyunsoonleella jejuensis]|uniref:Lipocalin-like domain-containing protein n=1 Tax=Hyunsoonleella jejuensis TaxID=419940 RepID=A0A1H9G4L1_9FLAO|nr:hypothetical protein [Hyunsoonleella jejuensis]SEQ45047.1 hypothetical protein SAMN05421824_1677 [Hyunsoonleella jejuensis]